MNIHFIYAYSVMHCVCIHVSSRRLLPVQTNTDEHDPQFCLENYARRNSEENMMKNRTADIISRCPPPLFTPAPPTVSARYVRSASFSFANDSSFINSRFIFLQCMGYS